jgi:hypothetical protein
MLGILVLSLYLAYRLSRYRSRSREIDERAKEINRLSAPPKSKKARHAPDRKVLEAPTQGVMVVMHREGESPAREMFVNALGKGRKGMVVSTQDPKEIPLDTEVPRIWLNRSKVKAKTGATVVNPTNLSGVLDEITSFVETNTPCVVILDRFEDVVGANDIQRVLRFLGMLRELSAKHKASFLVPIGYRALPQRPRNQIMESFETVVV